MNRFSYAMRSYMTAKTGNVLTRYAIWATIGAIAISAVSVTSAEFVVNIVEEDAQIEQANLQDRLDHTGNYETADIPVRNQIMEQKKPLILPFLRRLAE